MELPYTNILSITPLQTWHGLMILRTGCPRPKCSGPQLPRDHSSAKPSAVKAQIPELPAPPSQWLPAAEDIIGYLCGAIMLFKKLRCQLKDIACDNFNRACSKGVRVGRIRWIFKSRRWQQNFASCRSSVLKVRNAGRCKGVTTSKLTESCKTALSTKEDLAFMIHKNHVRNSTKLAFALLLSFLDDSITFAARILSQECSTTQAWKNFNAEPHRMTCRVTKFRTHWFSWCTLPTKYWTKKRACLSGGLRMATIQLSSSCSAQLGFTSTDSTEPRNVKHRLHGVLHQDWLHVAAMFLQSATELKC